MVAALALETGWGWDHILDTVDTRRLQAITERANECPGPRRSLHHISLMLQHALGAKTAAPGQKPAARADEQPPEFALLPRKEE